MLKKIDILGIEVDNYTVREAMMQVENYLDNTVMNTIETIDMKMLELAGRDETVRACIEQLDLAVIGEKEILIAADVHSSQRISETINHDFSGNSSSGLSVTIREYFYWRKPLLRKNSWSISL